MRVVHASGPGPRALVGPLVTPPAPAVLLPPGWVTGPVTGPNSRLLYVLVPRRRVRVVLFWEVSSSTNYDYNSS